MVKTTLSRTSVAKFPSWKIFTESKRNWGLFRRSEGPEFCKSLFVFGATMYSSFRTASVIVFLMVCGHSWSRWATDFCPCDLTEDECDPDCCFCDPDCSVSPEVDPAIPDGCVSFLQPAQGVLNCSSSSRSNVASEEALFLCIQRSNSPFLGLFHPYQNLPSSDSNKAVLRASDSSGREGYRLKYKSRTRRGDSTGIAGDDETLYADGDPVRTVYNLKDAAYGVLNLPSTGAGGGACVSQEVRYLREFSSWCSIRLDKGSNCRRNTVLDHQRFLMVVPNAEDIPNLAQVLRKRKDDTGAVVPLSVSYYSATPEAAATYLRSQAGYLRTEGRQSRRISLSESIVGTKQGQITKPFRVNGKIVDFLPNLDNQVHYEDKDSTCYNVVLEAHYRLKWRKGLIVAAEAHILMGNVTLPVEGGSDRPRRRGDRDLSSTIQPVHDQRVDLLTTHYSVRFEHQQGDPSASLKNNSINSTAAGSSRADGKDGSSNSEVKPPEIYQSSGNPGYSPGSPLLSVPRGKNMSEDNQQQRKVLQRGGLKMFDSQSCPGPFGAFAPGEHKFVRVKFLENVRSGCLITLTRANFSDCAQLRRTLATSVLGSLIEADYVFKGGDDRQGNRTENDVGLDELVPIIGLSDIMRGGEEHGFEEFEVLEAQENEPKMTQVRDDESAKDQDLLADGSAVAGFGLSPLKRVVPFCRGVPVHLHLQVFYTRFDLKVKKRPENYDRRIFRIAAVKVSLFGKDLVFTCSNPHECINPEQDPSQPLSSVQSSELLRPVHLESSVSFIEVPVRWHHQNTSRFWVIQDQKPCPADTCWKDIFYPLTAAAKGDDFIQAIIWMVVAPAGGATLWAFAKLSSVRL